MFIKLSAQEWFELILSGCTILVISIYAYAYFMAETKYGERYIPIINTIRTIVLASFLIFFYNPLRSTFDYGRSLPFFAFSAGVSLLLLLDKYQILNLLHFILYGKPLPENPQKSCGLVEANVGVPKKI